MDLLDRGFFPYWPAGFDILNDRVEENGETKVDGTEANAEQQQVGETVGKKAKG